MGGPSYINVLRRAEIMTKEVGMFVAFDSEVRFAEAMGLPKEKVKEMRLQLEKGRDWDFHKKAVWFSASGVERMMDAMGLKGGRVVDETHKDASGLADSVKPAQVPDHVEKTPPDEDVEAGVDLVVRRLLGGGVWVEAILPNKNRPRLVAVRVRDNRVMRPGMVLKRCNVHPGPLGEKGRWIWEGR